VPLGQVQPNIENGFKSYGSYDSSTIDTVNLGNGGLTLHIPLPFSYPQRGGSLTPSYFLVSTSKSWQVQDYIPPGESAVYYWNYGPEANSGFFAGEIAGPLGPYLTSTLPLTFMRWWEEQIDGSNNVTMWDGGYRIRGWDNAIHELSDVSGGKRNAFESMDTSGYHVVPSPPQNFPYSTPTSITITDRKGNAYKGSMYNDVGSCTRTTTGGIGGTTTIICQQPVIINTITDSNGNVYDQAVSGAVDTLGRALPLQTTSSSSTAGCVSSLPMTGSVLYSYTGPNAAAEQIQACLGNLPIQTNFGQSGVQEFGFHGAPNPASVIVTLILPNNTKWTFSYNSYGDVTSIGLPNGGSITYTWKTIPLPNCNGSDAKVSRAVASRTVFDGTNSYTWKYTWGTYSGSTVTNVVTDPLGNDVVHIFTSLGGPSSCTPYEAATKSYTGLSTNGGTLLKEVDTTYSYGGPGCDNSPCGIGNVVPTIIQTTDYPNGVVAAVTKSYDSGYGANEPIFGNVTTESDYDWGNGTKGSLLRQTTTSYQFQSNSNYLTGNLLDLPASIVVSNAAGYKCSETDYTYDNSSYLTAANVTEQHGAPPGPVRGNLSSTSRQLSSTPCQQSATWSPITSYTNMYDTGELYKSIDPLNNATTYTYSSTFAGAYPTTVTNALNQATQYNYDFSTGLLTSETDANLQPTTGQYDIVFRPTLISYPDGGSTSYCYTDMGGSACSKSGAPYSVVTTKAITSSPVLNEVSTVVFDGLGRLSQTQLNSDPDGTDYTLTTYDALGRKSQVYNPTRCSSITTNCETESTWGYTTTSYDALSRVTSVLEQDNSTVSTSYTAYPCTTVTDEAGHSRESCVDGLGRMNQVLEDPGTPPHLNYATQYVYDALGDLTNVTQNGSNSSYSRNRTFQYDSLSRLTSAANPESGTITYTYDANSNLATRVAPEANQTSASKNTTTSYTYDVLNRLTEKTYASPSTGAVHFAYDVAGLKGCPGPEPPTINGPTNLVGRRTAMCSSNSSSAWSYDSMGRPLFDARDNKGSSAKVYTIGYTYYQDGSLASLTYPSGDVIGYGLGGAERYTSVADANNVYTYFAHYTPAGYLWYADRYDVFPSNWTTAASLFNNRQQLTELDLFQSSVSTPIWGICYDFHPTTQSAGSNCSFSANPGDNGNLFGAASPSQGFCPSCDPTHNAVFSYDPLNRLSQANTVATSGQNCWGEVYTIDAWGNLTNRAGVPGMSGCSTEPLNLPATTQNQLTGLSYDAAGNLTNDGNGNQPTYDTENRIATDAAVTYSYDADGARIEKSSGTMYWPGHNGEILAETDLNGNVNEEYIYLNGQRIARIDRPSGTVHYYFSDPLGSTAVITDIAGNIQQQYYYYPYGGLLSSVGSDPNHYKFTGKERDSESGLDNFGARYNASSMGRFMSPDPNQDSGFEHMDDPQSWNGYAYVRNSPTTGTDPDGRNYTICDSNGKNCADLNEDQYKQYLQSLQGTNTTVNSAGQIQHTNDNGSVTNLGTATYYNEKDIQAAQFLVQTGKTLGDPRTIAGFYGASFLLGGCAIACPAAYSAAATTATGLLYTGLRAGMVIGGYVMTSHAVEQAEERGVTAEEIEEAVEGVAKSNPQNAWDSVQRFYTATCEVRVNKVTGTIVTVISKISR
jgi:RHS repeat-associated protein